MWTDIARHVTRGVLLSRRWPRLKLAEKWLRREAIIVRPWSWTMHLPISHSFSTVVSGYLIATIRIPQYLHNDMRGNQT